MSSPGASPQVQELLRRFDHAAMGVHDRWDLGKNIERMVEASGDEQLLYAVRMRLVGHAHHVVDARAQLSLFLWCAHKNYTDPSRFAVRPVAHEPDIDLLWMYKWLTGMLCAWPQYSVRQITDAVEMMREAFKREGAGMAGIAWAEFNLALEVGSDDEVREAIAKVRSTPADEYSNCDACSRASFIAAFHGLGDHERAYSLLRELLEGRYTCAEEPEHIISDSLSLALTQGGVQEAAQLQERSYPMVISRASSVSAHVHHMMFFLRTGNPAHAYRLLTRHIENVWHEGLSPASVLSGLTGLLGVSRHLSDDGHGNLPLPSTGSEQARRFLNLAENARALTLDQFILAARPIAEDLAAQFDARNANTRHADALHQAFTAELDLTPFDLGGGHVPEQTTFEARHVFFHEPAQAADSAGWRELALETDCMQSLTTGYGAARRALERAHNDQDTYAALVLALQEAPDDDFDTLLDHLVALVQGAGDHEAADNLKRYHWKLWREHAPRTVRQAEVPELDPLHELHHASSPLWRYELGMLLAEQSAPGVIKLAVSQREKNTALQAWDAKALTRLRPLARLSRENAADHAHTLHAHVLSHPDEEVTWDFWLAYAYSHALASGFDFASVQALRSGNNFFPTLPPMTPAIREALDLQVSAARAYGSAAVQVSALRAHAVGLASTGGTNESDVFTRLGELAAKVRHPFLACRLMMEEAIHLASIGAAPRARARMEHALALFDAATTRIRVDDLEPSERTYLTRATILEALFALLEHAGDEAAALAVGLDVIRELEGASSTTAQRQRRLIEARHSTTNLMLMNHNADIHLARSLALAAAEEFEQLEPWGEDDELHMLGAHVCTQRAEIHRIFDEKSQSRDGIEQALAHAIHVTGSAYAPMLSEVYSRLHHLATGFDLALVERIRAQARSHRLT